MCVIWNEEVGENQNKEDYRHDFKVLKRVWMSSSWNTSGTHVGFNTVCGRMHVWENMGYLSKKEMLERFGQCLDN